MRTLSRAIPADCRLLRSDGLQRWFVHEPRGAHADARVIKQLAPSVSLDRAVTARWLQVAAQNAELQHPACTQVEDWGVHDGAAYVVSKAASGVPLRVMLESVAASGARLAAELVAPIGIMILDALDYALQREPALLHLDLDLEGITVRSDGAVVLPEFALWSVLPPADVARCRFDSGRVQYCSPELVQSRRGDCRSDVFSVGAVLYQLLTGELPFAGTTHLVMAMAIADGKRDAVHERAPDAPEGLCDILEAMLATSAAERFQSPAAAANALRCIVRAQGDAGQPVSPSRLAAPALAVAKLASAPGAGGRGEPPVRVTSAVSLRRQLLVHDGSTAFLRERPRHEPLALAAASREPHPPQPSPCEVSLREGPRPEPTLLAEEPREPPLLAPGSLSHAPALLLSARPEPALFLQSVASLASEPLAASWLGSGKKGSWLDPSETVFQARVRPLVHTGSAAPHTSLLLLWSRPIVFGLAAIFLVAAALWALSLL